MRGFRVAVTSFHEKMNAGWHILLVSPWTGLFMTSMFKTLWAKIFFSIKTHQRFKELPAIISVLCARISRQCVHSHTRQIRDIRLCMSYVWFGVPAYANTVCIRRCTTYDPVKLITTGTLSPGTHTRASIHIHMYLIIPLRFMYAPTSH